MPRATVHTGRVARATAHTGRMPRATAHTGRVARATAHTGRMPRATGTAAVAEEADTLTPALSQRERESGGRLLAGEGGRGNDE
jgi:hypothetical protein